MADARERAKELIVRHFSGASRGFAEGFVELLERAGLRIVEAEPQTLWGWRWRGLGRRIWWLLSWRVYGGWRAEDGGCDVVPRVSVLRETELGVEERTGFDAVIAALAGHRVPGGCQSCDAYQTVENDPALPGVNHFLVHHHDGCPVLARKRGGA